MEYKIPALFECHGSRISALNIGGEAPRLEVSQALMPAAEGHPLYRFPKAARRFVRVEEVQGSKVLVYREIDYSGNLYFFS